MLALLDRDGADEHGQPPALDLLDLGPGDRLSVLRTLLLEDDLVVGLRGDSAHFPGAVGQGERVPAVDPLDLVGHRDPLLPLCPVDHVGMVDPLEAPVGRDRDHIELVDLPELVGLGHGRAGHAAELFVELEEVLERDGGEGLRLLLDPHSFLGLDRLMETVGPLPARHQSAGEFVDDHHLPLLDDVVDVSLVEMMSLERIVDQVRPFHVADGVEALHPSELLGRPHALLRQGDGVLLFLDLKMLLRLELPGDLIGSGVFRDVVVGRTRDDQRGAGLVDQDVVHLVDDREVERPLGLLHVLGKPVVVPSSHPHIVTEVVETELVVGAVGDVAGVGLLAGSRIHPRLDRAHREAEAEVERSHPLHVAAGQVVIDRDDMHPLALEGIEVGRERGDESLALARDHLGDPT